MSYISLKKPKDFSVPNKVCKTRRRKFSEDEAKSILEHGEFCHYCGVEGPMCFDHITPRINGGGDHHTNLVPACRSCNSSKGTKEYDEFIEWREAELFAFVVMHTMGDCL